MKSNELMVNVKNLRYLTASILMFCASVFCLTAQADELKQDCAEIHAKLQTVQGAVLHWREGDFTDTNTCATCQFPGTYYKLVLGGSQYHGCILSLKGNDKKVKGNFSLDEFAAYDGSQRYQEGWRIDQSEDADGPDGTHFKEDKGGVVCLFDGHWDGGEDSNPKYAPSPLFEYDVACGIKIN